MFERQLADLEFEGLSVDSDEDFGSPAVMIRTLLLAATMLPSASPSRVAAAMGDETERLVQLDPQAAERALSTLRQMRERLERALSETRIADVLSAALVRAADALPETNEVKRA